MYVLSYLEQHLTFVLEISAKEYVDQHQQISLTAAAIRYLEKARIPKTLAKNVW